MADTDLKHCVTYSCYAWRSGGVWEALCVDLDIAVQGESFDAVYRCLNAAVIDYVETVLELPEQDRSRLLHLRALFWTRVRVQIGFWLAGMWQVVKHGNGAHGSLPVSAVVA